jgi:hypothetical protein
MKKIQITILALGISVSGIGQTKKIAHKSHNGSEASFLASNYMDNLGDPPMFHVDSITKITDTTALQYCSRWRGGRITKDTIKYREDFYEMDSIKKVNDTMALKFSTGFLNKKQKTDTVIHEKNNLNHHIMRGDVVNPYRLQHYPSVKFIGFKDSVIKEEVIPAKKRIKKRKKKQLLPLINMPKSNNNTNSLILFIWVAVSVLVLLFGMLYFRFKKEKYTPQGLV